jgi:predicted ABC-type transport system involved in lysophospholipase L1 biosynthesis ATPase subunit
MLLELNQEFNTSLLLVTHDIRLAARMDHRLELHMGCLQEIN